MKARLFGIVGGTSLLVLGTAYADSSWLPFRVEAGTCIYNGSTTQTIETVFGSSPVGLPFTGTSSYDFYSPPLAAPVMLTTADRTGGGLFMENTSPSAANNFSVMARMQYFDYDQATGVEIAIGDTSDSSPQPINRTSTKAWQLPKIPLPANHTVPAGHLLHVKVTVNLISGNPGTFANLIYNNDRDHGTLGIFPQDRDANWTFGPLGSSAPDASVTVASPWVAANSAGHIATAPDVSGATYLWTISNGTITAGQGTSQITWTAGADSQVSLGVTITKGCSSSAFVSVNVSTPIIGGPAPRIIRITPAPALTVKLDCTGVAGQSYTIQGTTDLGSDQWDSVGAVVASPDGSFNLVDQDAPNFSRRFYRLATTW